MLLKCVELDLELSMGWITDLSLYNTVAVSVISQAVTADSADL